VNRFGNLFFSGPRFPQEHDMKIRGSNQSDLFQNSPSTGRGSDQTIIQIGNLTKIGTSFIE
jgi:hypothetical protein